MTTTKNAAIAWLETVTTDSDNEVASRTGIPQTTLWRQLNGDRLKVENAMLICHTYGASRLDALVALGVITEHDAEGIAGAASLRSASDDELAKEVLRRLSERRGGALDEPLEG